MPESNIRKINAKVIINTIAVIMSLYHLYTCLFGIPESQMHREIHLMFALILSFGTYNLAGKKNNDKVSVFDWILAGVSVVSLGYMAMNTSVFQNRIAFVTPLTMIQKVMLILILILVLESTRRLTGWTLPIACLVFIAYALWGQHFPGALAHNGFSVNKILEQITLTSEGIFGSSLGITATYVVVFIILAGFLEVTGAGQFFIDIATGITGSKRGGPAKAAIVGSCLFGSISGSSVANVVSTGTFTIPLSKSVGYAPEFAAAVEAVASTGGQIMPPVMAAVAFIMADFLGVSYISICAAALIPALLYYITLFFMVDAKAVKMGINGLEKSQLPNTKEVMKKGWFQAIPFAVLIGMMVANYTPMKAGFYALISLLVVQLILNRKVLTLDNILTGLEKGAKGVISVSTTSACAGIIVGVIMLTGLGTKFTSLISLWSGGHLMIALLLSAVVAIILGMGLPTVPAYIVMSSLVAPALIQMGVEPLAAHMFVLYFAVLSCITPPVAIASYAAAAIADANAVKVGFQSVRLAFIAYIIPFLFVYNPVLLAQGGILLIVWAFITAVIGCQALTWALEGAVENKLAPAWRILALAGGVCLLLPETLSDIPGLIIFAILYYRFRIKVKKEQNVGSVKENGRWD